MVDTRNAFKLESAGTLTAAANKDRWQAPFDGEIVDVSAVVGTAPTGSTLILDLLLDGASVFPTGKPTVAIAATEVNGVVPTGTKEFVKGQTYSLSITQIGSGTAGADLDVTVQYIST